MPDEPTPPETQEVSLTRSDLARLEGIVRDTHATVQNVNRILVGEPEFKRPGIVEMVDRHEKLITRGGGAFGAAYILWEGLKILGHIGK